MNSLLTGNSGAPLRTLDLFASNHCAYNLVKDISAPCPLNSTGMHKKTAPPIS